VLMANPDRRRRFAGFVPAADRVFGDAKEGA
jgi:hypothetical protein